MNRHQRRRQAAINGQNNLYNGYLKHLPEIGPLDVSARMGRPGVVHTIMFHDDWCSIYDGKGGGVLDCNCNPRVEYRREPERS